MSKFPLIVASLALVSAMTVNAASAGESSLAVSDWGKLPTGEVLKQFKLTNDNGMTVTISNLGALITSICVPDKTGKIEDVTLGFDTFEPYLSTDCPYFGAVVGRYGNRIGKGQFTIDGQTFNLTKNENGKQTLHGGNIGFNKKVWTVEEVTIANRPADMSEEDAKAVIGLKLTMKSADGEEGFPGNLDVAVYYLLCRKSNTLIIAYGAKTDKPTHVNLTQHSYFNLKGQGNGNILDQELQIFADKMTPVDADLITTGEFRDVTGTPFDFRQATVIGKRIDDVSDEQIKLGGGYDHNFVLNEVPVQTDKGENAHFHFRPAAVVRDPASGRQMRVFTTEPGVQFYAGNFLPLEKTLAGKAGKAGKVYERRAALCLETQHFPDSPNKPNFPSTLLKPGEIYKTATVFHFSTDSK